MNAIAWKTRLRQSVAFTFVFVLAFVYGGIPVAAAPTEAALTLGDSRPEITTTYSFSVNTLDTGSDVACVELDLGANSDGSGAVSGLDTSSSTLSSNSIVTGTTVSNAEGAAHILRASKATASNPNATGTVVWGAVVNGDTADTGYYGVFSTYSDQSCSSLNESITVQFIYTEGQQVSLTVDPSFSFTVAGVASAATVNSETTTVTSTSTTVPFGLVTTADNEVAAQDLEIGTNAQNGYFIYMRQTAALTNGTSDTIDAVSVDTACSYAAPDTFSTPGTEAFGFTTNDADVSSGNYIANNWCDVTGTNQVVGTNTAPPAGTDTVRVGYQVGVSAATEPGTYSNTIIYTATPTY
jgi:hypothetical protein